MTQSRKGSAAEAVANIAIGYGVNFTCNAMFLPLLGVHITFKENAVFGVIMTVVSLIRSYTLRRVFNATSFGNVQSNP